MIREQLKEAIAQKVSEFVGSWDSRVEVVRTENQNHGDFSTNIAMKLAPIIKRTPLEVAKDLTDSLEDQAYIKKLEVVEPGFINIFIEDNYWLEQVQEVLVVGNKFGSNKIGHHKKARVEFVSANPTGPLHFGNARGGPIGDVIASVLEFSGYEVIREYYHNDVGVQVEKLGESILNVAKGENLNEQEYKGDYIKELASEIGVVKSPQEAGKKAVDLIYKSILVDCETLGIKFDQTFSESELIESGKTKNAVEELIKKDFIKDKDGAKWFAPNDEFLKDRETVVMKSEGSYTYFANDIAYHKLKFESGADLVIDILGANHHGHVPRLQAVISALGFEPAKFKVVLYQWVRFKKDEEVIAMSKRSGNFVTAQEVINEVGSDAVRFFILMHDPNSPIDFDLELAKKKSRENPVYYVQYAYARIASILKKADVGSQKSEVNYSLLTTDFELALIKQISRLPEIVLDAVNNLGVHRLTDYSRELADAFHKFYENCQVITDDEALSLARLSLAKATKITLENSLKLLGISTPTKM